MYRFFCYPRGRLICLAHQEVVHVTGRRSFTSSAALGLHPPSFARIALSVPHPLARPRPCHASISVAVLATLLSHLQCVSRLGGRSACHGCSGTPAPSSEYCLSSPPDGHAFLVAHGDQDGIHGHRLYAAQQETAAAIRQREREAGRVRRVDPLLGKVRHARAVGRAAAQPLCHAGRSRLLCAQILGRPFRVPPRAAPEADAQSDSQGLLRRLARNAQAALGGRVARSGHHAGGRAPEAAKEPTEGRTGTDAPWLQSLGWEHYEVHEPEPHILLFKFGASCSRRGLC